LGDLRLRHALLIGCAQAFALIPGTSRSGVTMTAARFLRFQRVDAARFSFLLGIPAIAGAGLLGFADLLEKGDSELWFDAGCGLAASFLAGLGAIHFMIRWLGRYGLMPFAIYRIFLGIGLIVYTLYQV
jgi:undecaprenyl-diphosphatase